MKRMTVLLTVLTVTALSSLALAGGPACSASQAKGACDAAATKAASLVPMSECCQTAAVAGTGCCGQDAAAVKATFADFQASQHALAGMHPCCAAAVAKSEGCCGKDATALKATYQTAMDEAKAKCASATGACPAAAGACAPGACGDKVKTEAKSDTKSETTTKTTASAESTTDVAAGGR